LQSILLWKTGSGQGHVGDVLFCEGKTKAKLKDFAEEKEGVMNKTEREVSGPSGHFFYVGICIIVWSCLILCGTATANQGRYGGTLTFGVENEFAGFEVIQSSSRLAINGAIAANTIMEPLFRMDDKGELIPVLGLSAVPSEQGRLWTIELRQGVKFHDGTPFNADAVIHHWQRMFNPENRFRGRDALSVIEAVEKMDDDTIGFRLKHPWLPFLQVISSTRGLINLIPSPRAVESGTQNRAPVGTGPFVFKDWTAGDRFVVEKNTAYWNPGTPYLDAIVFRPIPDSQTRFVSLKSGQLEVIWSDRGNIIAKAGQDPALTVYQSDDNGAEIFILNTAHPPLDDVRVRRALAHAHSQQRHVAMVYKDSIPVVHHPFGADIQCPEDGYREFNPEKAIQLLTASTPLTELELLHSNSPRGRETGEITQQLLKNIGVQATPVGLNFGPVIKRVLSGQYQVSTWRISSRPDQGPALVRAFHSASPGNLSKYHNREMDRLLSAQRTEVDPVRRRQLLCEIARLINEDVPILYRGGMRSHVIVNKKVNGIGSIYHGIVRLEAVWLK
jgi:4-phytase/acid phosphatase/peptide/nickel transport system substrate-binding protein